MQINVLSNNDTFVGQSTTIEQPETQNKDYQTVDVENRNPNTVEFVNNPFKKSKKR